MITNWDIISRTNPKTGVIHYTLVTNGAESDVRLISKKLAGYIVSVQQAIRPFVYGFVLHNDLDETTLDKIRAAVREVVQQSGKINQFVPGGAVGDPLFNSTVNVPVDKFSNTMTMTVASLPELNLDDATIISFDRIGGNDKTAEAAPSNGAVVQDEKPVQKVKPDLPSIDAVSLTSQTEKTASPDAFITATTKTPAGQDSDLKPLGGWPKELDLPDIDPLATAQNTATDAAQTPKKKKILPKIKPAAPKAAAPKAAETPKPAAPKPPLPKAEPVLPKAAEIKPQEQPKPAPKAEPEPKIAQAQPQAEPQAKAQVQPAPAPKAAEIKPQEQPKPSGAEITDFGEPECTMDIFGPEAAPAAQPAPKPVVVEPVPQPEAEPAVFQAAPEPQAAELKPISYTEEPAARKQTAEPAPHAAPKADVELLGGQPELPDLPAIDPLAGAKKSKKEDDGLPEIPNVVPVAMQPNLKKFEDEPEPVIPEGVDLSLPEDLPLQAEPEPEFPQTAPDRIVPAQPAPSAQGKAKPEAKPAEEKAKPAVRKVEPERERTKTKRRWTKFKKEPSKPLPNMGKTQTDIPQIHVQVRAADFEEEKPAPSPVPEHAQTAPVPAPQPEAPQAAQETISTPAPSADVQAPAPQPVGEQATPVPQEVPAQEPPVEEKAQDIPAPATEETKSYVDVSLDTTADTPQNPPEQTQGLNFSLEDMLLAETKYDIFVDVAGLQTDTVQPTQLPAEQTSAQPVAEHQAAQTAPVPAAQEPKESAATDAPQEAVVTPSAAASVRLADVAQDGRTGEIPLEFAGAPQADDGAGYAQNLNAFEPVDMPFTPDADMASGEPLAGADTPAEEPQAEAEPEVSAAPEETQQPPAQQPEAAGTGADAAEPAAEAATNDLPDIHIRKEAEKKQIDTHSNKETDAKMNYEENEELQGNTPTAPTSPDAAFGQHKPVLRLKKRMAPPPPVPPAPKKPQGAGGVLRIKRKPKQDLFYSGHVVKTTLDKVQSTDLSIEMPLSELKKYNWPLEIPLVPTYTLDNMIMSVNRFAHATAVSVVGNPGNLYNPLVLHGPSGTGKTHFLNALAYAFSKKIGQEHIFLTNGVRLSRGIQRYVAENNVAELENFFKNIQVLLSDDIHLLAINEQNRAQVSKLLNSFLRDRKQIVISSKYPPESLEKLEELIKFRLDSGWISELRNPDEQTHLRIVKKMLADNNVEIPDAKIKQFFGQKDMSLGAVKRYVRRLKVLEKFMPHLSDTPSIAQGAILEKLLAAEGEDATSEITKKRPADITSVSLIGDGEWGRIGFFYPQNAPDMMNWMVYCLEQRARELGIHGGIDIAVRSSYSTENIISSAFKIANLCDNKKLRGAVILGPQPGTCDVAVRDNFYDIITHMLEIMLIRCGVINYEAVELPSTYVKIIAELMR